MSDGYGSVTHRSVRTDGGERGARSVDGAERISGSFDVEGWVLDSFLTERAIIVGVVALALVLNKAWWLL